MNICTNFMAIHPIVVGIFKSGPKCWIDRLTNIPRTAPSMNRPILGNCDWITITHLKVHLIHFSIAHFSLRWRVVWHHKTFSTAIYSSFMKVSSRWNLVGMILYAAFSFINILSFHFLEIYQKRTFTLCIIISPYLTHESQSNSCWLFSPLRFLVWPHILVYEAK